MLDKPTDRTVFQNAWVVDDVEAARELLEHNGCKVLHWEGAGKACFIEDPFGVRFNLWQN